MLWSEIKQGGEKDAAGGLVIVLNMASLRRWYLGKAWTLREQALPILGMGEECGWQREQHVQRP